MSNIILLLGVPCAEEGTLGKENQTALAKRTAANKCECS